MSDGKNEARALRVHEILNDYRTIDMNTLALTTRSQAPTQQAFNLPGYSILRSVTEELSILNSSSIPGAEDLMKSKGQDPSENNKKTLQRIILDASSRRWKAHKLYLRAAAATRWVQLRQQIEQSTPQEDQRNQAMRPVDYRFRREIEEITDQAVFVQLHEADMKKGYWISEDPTLAQIVAWSRVERSAPVAASGFGAQNPGGSGSALVYNMKG